MRMSDWSSDVCSSDLLIEMRPHRAVAAAELHAEPVGDMQRGIGEHGIFPELERDVEGDDIAQQRTRGILRPDLLSDRGVLVGRSEEHTSELQSLMRISYAVFCLKKKQSTRNSTY